MDGRKDISLPWAAEVYLCVQYMGMYMAKPYVAHLEHLAIAHWTPTPLATHSKLSARRPNENQWE